MCFKHPWQWYWIQVMYPDFSCVSCVTHVSRVLLLKWSQANLPRQRMETTPQARHLTPTPLTAVFNLTPVDTNTWDKPVCV